MRGAGFTTAGGRSPWTAPFRGPFTIASFPSPVARTSRSLPPRPLPPSRPVLAAVERPRSAFARTADLDRAPHGCSPDGPREPIGQVCPLEGMQTRDDDLRPHEVARESVGEERGAMDAGQVDPSLVEHELVTRRAMDILEMHVPPARHRRRRDSRDGFTAILGRG